MCIRLHARPTGEIFTGLLSPEIEPGKLAVCSVVPPPYCITIHQNHAITEANLRLVQVPDCRIYQNLVSEPQSQIDVNTPPR